MSYKRYTWLIIIIFFSIFISNVVLWEMKTQRILSEVNGYGDLSRLGYVTTTPALTSQKEKMAPAHIEMDEYINSNTRENIDILTIGDSFFNGGGGCYFQDILTSDYGYKVLNAKGIEKYEALEMVAVLLNNGYIEKIKPRVIIVESVGRFIINRYGNIIDFTDPKYFKSQVDIDNYYGKSRNNKPNEDKRVTFFDPRMFEVNLKFLRSSVNLQSNDGKLNDSVYHAKLTKPLFSNSDQEKLLLYYHGDVKVKNVNRQSIGNLNDNLTRLSTELRKQNIQLVFLPAVDKYDLYYDFMQNPQFPANPMFEYMEELDKNYTFLNTKTILRKELEQGEQDIYWLDDTHWSWKGQAVVAENLAKIIK